MASLGLFAFALFAACAQLAGIDEGHLAMADAESDVDVDASDDADADADASDASDAKRPNVVPAGMVLIAVQGGGSFFIDAKEATVAEYNAVVTAGGPPTVTDCPKGLSNRLQGCSFEGTSSLRRTTDAAQPVNCVTWCEAAIYCAAKGKRLCGAIGGGPLGNSFTSDPNLNEWARACGGINGHHYPYGNEFEAGACSIAGDAALPEGGGPEPRTSCEGSVPGLYDMGGSLAEWTDGRSGVDASVQSSVQGAAFRYTCATSTDCTCQNIHPAFTFAHDDVGIRCCKDVDGP